MPRTSILPDYRVSDAEWECISHFFGPEPDADNVTGRPAIPNRVVFQALLYYFADRVPSRRCRRYLGVSYRTLMRRLDAWIRAGVFTHLLADSIRLHDELCGLRTSLLLIDGCITQAPNGGQTTGRNPTDRAKKGTKRSPVLLADGLLVGCAFDAANVHDVHLVEAALHGLLVPVAEAAELSADRGYAGRNTAERAARYGLAIRINRPEPRDRRPRWIIETTHRIHNAWRGIKHRAIRLADRYQALFLLAATIANWRLTSRLIATR